MMGPTMGAGLVVRLLQIILVIGIFAININAQGNNEQAMPPARPLSAYNNNGNGIASKLNPGPPRMDISSPSHLKEAGICSNSIFDTRVPWTAGFPDETASRLTHPAKHPDHNICGSLVGKQSCCTAQTLQDIVAWADAMDSTVLATRYWRGLVERDPRQLVDQVFVLLRSIVGPEKADWAALRVEFRDMVGKLIGSWWKDLNPATQKLWATLITYQEGLLCSACYPEFSQKFLNGSNIIVRQEAALDVANAAVELMTASDKTLEDPENLAQLKEVAQRICTAIAGAVKCATVPYAVPIALNYITTSPLRDMICGYTKGDINVHNEFCKQFIMNSVLRGLYLDTLPIFNNILAACPKGIPGINCEHLDDTRKALANMYFTFDERPVATNVYVNEGFDIKQAACESNLSGYACGKTGPRPEIHQGDAPAGNSGPIIITIVVLLTVAALGAVLFISRDRIKRLGQSTLYRLMRDDGTGPTVGLV